MKKIFVLVVTFLVIQLKAQNPETQSPIIFIFDASGSMWGQIKGKTKIEIATEVLSNSIKNLPDNQQIGLVAYGHRNEGDCKDVEFLVDVAKGTKAQVNQSLNAIKPLGKTPLAYSAEEVIDILRALQIKATIILITDGIESCGGNICDVINAAREEGISFRLHIIGFGLESADNEQLRCAAIAGEGKYYDAVDASDLAEVLNEATDGTVDNLRFNFTGYATKNAGPVDALFKAYDVNQKNSILGARTYKDTARMYLPPGTYNLEIQPMENSDVSRISVPNVLITPNQIFHQNVSFDAAKLKVSTLNNGEGWDATVRVYSKLSGKNVASARTYGRSQVLEVDPGIYNIELGALIIEGSDRIHRIENIEVTAGEVKEISHNFKSGIALIGVRDQSGLVDATINIVESKTNKNVAAGRTYTSETSNPKKFILSPGSYDVTVKPVKGENKEDKEVFSIVIKEGETLEEIKKYQ